MLSLFIYLFIYLFIIVIVIIIIFYYLLFLFFFLLINCTLVGPHQLWLPLPCIKGFVTSETSRDIVRQIA